MSVQSGGMAGRKERPLQVSFLANPGPFTATIEGDPISWEEWADAQITVNSCRSKLVSGTIAYGMGGGDPVRGYGLSVIGADSETCYFQQSVGYNANLDIQNGQVNIPFQVCLQQQEDLVFNTFVIADDAVSYTPAIVIATESKY